MTDMKNKTVIVTGGTNGIGEVTARELARMGANVVVISRSVEKCRATVEAIKTATGNNKIEYIAADLSSIKDIHRAADEFKSKHSRLDVLVNNAGAYFQSFQQSVDGFEMTFALNHINYFLLTHLLLDMLKATAKSEGEARVINVSSDAHQMVQKLDFNNVPRKSGAGFPVYGESKYMNIIFTYELAERLAGTGVTVNVLHPGFVRSGFGKNNNWLIGAVMNVIQLFGISADSGAETSIYLASSPDVKGVTGQYFVKKKAVKSNTATYDHTAWKNLWTLSEKLTGIGASV